MRNPSSPPNAFVKPEWPRLLPLLLGLLAPAAGAEGWEPRQYNPQPAEGDVVLPMPCGGAMAFREIETEANGPLGEQMVRLGSTDAGLGYMEGAMTTHVAGSFPGRQPASRYFLLGKYEVTKQQYQAVLSGKCESLPDGNLPQAQLNWFDAVSFADRYTQWLLKNARDKLPRDGESPGFVRLPTEAEWEFAARGGRRLSVSDFEAPTFPMPEGRNAYVWYSGSESSKGQAQPIGLKKPNPLGLHDMLGNVDEIVFDLFRLAKHSHWHGRAGAFVVRGGNYATAESQVRSSFRQEVPYYKDDQPRRVKTTGLRVALAGPVLNQANLAQFRDAWARLPDAEAAAPAPRKPVPETPAPALPDAQLTRRIDDLEARLKECREARPDAVVASCPDPLGHVSAQAPSDPLADIRDLAGKTEHPVLKRRLDRLWTGMAALVEVQHEQRSRAAREALRTAAMVCQKLRDDDHNVIKGFEFIKKRACDRDPAGQDCRNYAAKFAKLRDRVAYNLGFYADAVLELAQSYPMEILTTEKDLLLASLEQRAYKDFMPFVKLLYEHARRFSASGKQDRDGWYKACVAVSIHEP